MSRNSSGTYTLPTGNPVVSGTVIEASWANGTLSDIAAALTDSLSRSGQGGMTAPLRIIDGSAAVPSLAFANETGSGAYRAAAGDWYLTVLGSGIARLRSSGMDVTGALGVSGNATVGGTLGVTGATTLSNNLTLNGTGARIIGDFSNGTVANRTIFQTSATNGVTILPVMPNGTATQSLFRAYNNSTPTNASFIDVTIDGSLAQINSNREGSGSLLPMAFGVNNAERMRIETSGKVSIGNTIPLGLLHVGTTTTNIAVPSGNFALVRGGSYFSGSAGGIQLSGCYGDNGTVGAFNIKAVQQDASYNNALAFTTTTAFSGAETERMRIDSSGNLLVGTTSTWFSRNAIFESAADTVATIASNSGNYPISVLNSATTGNNNFIGFWTEARGLPTQRGYIYFDRAAGQTKLSATSDERLKQNIVDAPSALAKIEAIKVREYKWKETGSKNIGFIAQELFDVVPRAVSVGIDNEDGSIKQPWGVDNGTLVPYLVKAIQELKAELDATKAEVAALKAAAK